MLSKDENGQPCEVFHGHASRGALSAFCRIAADGTLVHEDYNLCDSTGPHPYRKGKKNASCWTALLEMREEARANARAALAYANERRRETTFVNLRYAWLVTEGRGGHTIEIDEERNVRASCQGYGLSAEELVEIERLKIPFIDTRTIPDRMIYETVSLPMVCDPQRKPDSAPYGSLSFAPLAVVAAAKKALGATVRNCPLDFEGAKQIHCLAKHDAALAAYIAGDELALSRAMGEGIHNE